MYSQVILQVLRHVIFCVILQLLSSDSQVIRQVIFKSFSSYSSVILMVILKVILQVILKLFCSVFQVILQAIL